MPTYNKNQKQFYSTRSEVLQKFREEEKKPCFCKKEEWAKHIYKTTCINCIRKENLSAELKKKMFFYRLKSIKILEN